MKIYSAGSTGIIKSSELDQIITDVKIQIRKLSQGYKEQIQRIGNFLKEKNLLKEEDICAEIKNALRDEIKERLVSSDTIERCCPDEWKRKTKPKDIEDPHLRIFEGKDQLEQAEETVTSTNLSVTPEGLVLEQEYKDADPKVLDEQSKQKERQDQIIKQQQTIKSQERELEKLRQLAGEQQAQQSQLMQENVDLKAQLEKLQENTKLDGSEKQGQQKVLVDEWILSKDLVNLRYLRISKLHIVIENGKYVKIEGVD